jgi:hypothetical protein
LKESISALGIVVLYFFNAAAPAKYVSQLIFTPAALIISKVGRVTSGPIPSPGINVIVCFISAPNFHIAKAAGKVQTFCAVPFAFGGSLDIMISEISVDFN